MSVDLSVLSAFERLPQQLLTITAGDVALIESTITSDGTAVDITGFEIWMTVKLSRGDTDADALIRKEIGQGIDVISTSGGTIIITLTESDTLYLQSHDTLFFDIRVKTPSNTIYSAAEGRLLVRRATTSTLD